MDIRFVLARLLAGSAALGMLAGCGGVAGMPHTVLASSSAAAELGGRSWMQPDAKRGALLYATGFFTCGYNIPYTCVYAYPSGKLVGALAVGDTSICSDRKGNVFFPDQYDSTVLEYAHGGTTPFAQLDDAGESPTSCSVDPNSGDLAVINACAKSSDYCVGPGSIAVYRRAKGTPTLYQGGDIDWYQYGGYDGSGDIFVDGEGPSPSRVFAFDELPRGAASLRAIALDSIPSSPEQIQWDGSALTIENYNPPAIYRLKISGSAANIVGETHLRGSSIGIGPAWIQGNAVVAPYGRAGKQIKFIGFWRYPAGGRAVQRIVNGFDSKDRGFSGVTISVAH